MSANRWQGRIFLGRDEAGDQQFHWVGRFRTRKERDIAVSRERIRIVDEGCDCKACTTMGFSKTKTAGLPTVARQVDRYLADYKRRNRGSSHDTQKSSLARFRKDFADRTIDVPRPELKDWIACEGDWKGHDPVPIGNVWALVSFYNWNIDEDEQPLTKSPARGLGGRIKGRSELPPPTEEEFQLLVDSCAALGRAYEARMRANFLFAAVMLVRPSEMVEFKESDFDLRTMRASKARRLYRGEVDEPKTGKKLIAITPPARDVIAPFLPGDGGHIFLNKSGGQLTTGTLYEYWRLVLARSGLAFDFYHATKHYGVWFLWTKMRLSDRAIAAQAGWKLSTVHKMLETYGHGDVGALAEVDAAFESYEGPGLRVIEGGMQS